MSNLLSSLKPFAPLLLTFFLPRAINLYRTVKLAYRTRPPPRPLPPDATRAINVLFFGACLFFLQTLSLPSLTGGLGWGVLRGAGSYENVFRVTNSRLKIPTDVLFARLALVRPNNVLTATDEVLRGRLASLASRILYLRYGPDTVLSCSFCTSDDPDTYLLHYLPINVLLPHLFNIFILGLSTSQPFSDPVASTWRSRFTILSLLLAGLDIFTTVTWIPHPDPNIPSPSGPFWILGLLRSLGLCSSLSLCAFLIYASATNRFVLFMSPITPAPDPETQQRRQAQNLTQLTVALQMAHTKLNAYSITRNAVVRDQTLKQADDEYWRSVVAMNGMDNGVWEDEEVQAAVARTMAGGGIDVEKINAEARSFVGNATRDLEKPIRQRTT